MAATIDPVRARACRPLLIVNADDFGMSPGINRGIMEAIAAGSVTSVSLMVGMPGSDDAMEVARAFADVVSVGLHLNLTVGRPLTRAESLVDRATGEFLPLGDLLRRALSGRLRSREVFEECRAQIQRARRATPALTHLDGHQHVHVLPGIAGAVRQAVAAEGIAVVRRPSEMLAGGPLWWRRLPQRTLLKAFTALARVRRWPATTTQHFAGGALLGARNFEAGLVRLLDELPEGTTELMVHPGYANEPLPGNDVYGAERKVELRALLSPAVRRQLHSGRIALINFSYFTCLRQAKPS